MTSRADRRRQERMRQFKRKTVTREDVGRIIERYHVDVVLPLLEVVAANNLPLHRRLWAWIKHKLAPAGNADSRRAVSNGPSDPPPGAED